MPGRTLTIGLLQHACPPSAMKDDNLARAEALAGEAVKRGAELLVTQELFAGYYFPQREEESRFDLAEPIPGPTTQRLADWARRWNVSVSGSIFEKRAPGVYHNTSVLLDPDGEIVGKYRKMHIPDDPRFYEKYYFTPGDLGFSSFGIANATGGQNGGTSGRGTAPDAPRAGMLVCWDQWFPEAARLTAMSGAELLLYPTAIGYYHGETPADREQQREAWRIIQRAHAIANGVFVAAINRIGTEDDLTFWGSSFVTDPGGVVLAEASPDREEALVVELDLLRIESIRRGWPFLRDRRTDAYEPLTRRMLS
ncbi:MAG: carbon-nitrogen hydrolase [Phycisphaeraceae bacterium]